MSTKHKRKNETVFNDHDRDDLRSKSPKQVCKIKSPFQKPSKYLKQNQKRKPIHYYPKYVIPPQFKGSNMMERASSQRKALADYYGRRISETISEEDSRDTSCEKKQKLSYSEKESVKIPSNNSPCSCTNYMGTNIESVHESLSTSLRNAHITDQNDFDRNDVGFSGLLIEDNLLSEMLQSGSLQSYEVPESYGENLLSNEPEETYEEDPIDIPYTSSIPEETNFENKESSIHPEEYIKVTSDGKIVDSSTDSSSGSFITVPDIRPYESITKDDSFHAQPDKRISIPNTNTESEQDSFETSSEESDENDELEEPLSNKEVLSDVGRSSCIINKKNSSLEKVPSWKVKRDISYDGRLSDSDEDIFDLKNKPNVPDITEHELPFKESKEIIREKNIQEESLPEENIEEKNIQEGSVLKETNDDSSDDSWMNVDGIIEANRQQWAERTAAQEIKALSILTGSIDKSNYSPEDDKRPPKFFIDTKHIAPVVDYQFLESLRNSLLTILKSTKVGFIGSTYNIITLENYGDYLRKKNNYHHSWLTDGKRYMLFLTNGNDAYFIDENNWYYSITGLIIPHYGDQNKRLTDSIFDGEFLIDRVGDKIIYMYLICNVFAVEGKFIDEITFMKRYKIIENIIILPRHKMSASEKISQPFEVGWKKFYENKDLTYTWTVLKKKVPHKMIGLVFYPNASNDYQHLKEDPIMIWLPSDYKTIDLRMRMSYNNKTHKWIGNLYASDDPDPYGKITHMTESQLKIYDNKIVKCKFDALAKKWTISEEQMYNDSVVTSYDVREFVKDAVTPIDFREIL